jgi:hypothetical protein
VWSTQIMSKQVRRWCCRRMDRCTVIQQRCSPRFDRDVSELRSHATYAIGRTRYESDARCVACANKSPTTYAGEKVVATTFLPTPSASQRTTGSRTSRLRQTRTTWLPEAKSLRSFASAARVSDDRTKPRATGSGAAMSPKQTSRARPARAMQCTITGRLAPEFRLLH